METGPPAAIRRRTRLHEHTDQCPVYLQPPPLISPRSPFCCTPPWGRSPRSLPLALPLNTSLARLCWAGVQRGEGGCGPLPVPAPCSLPELEGRYPSIHPSTSPGRGTCTMPRGNVVWHHRDKKPYSSMSRDVSAWGSAPPWLMCQRNQSLLVLEMGRSRKPLQFWQARHRLGGHCSQRQHGHCLAAGCGCLQDGAVRSGVSSAWPLGACWWHFSAHNLPTGHV